MWTRIRNLFRRTSAIAVVASPTRSSQKADAQPAFSSGSLDDQRHFYLLLARESKTEAMRYFWEHKAVGCLVRS